MKSNVADSRMMKRTLGVLGLVAGAGLAAGFMMFAGYNRQIETNEHEAELIQSMVEAARSDQLLRELNSPEPEMAKMQLKSSLANSLENIETLTPTAKRPLQLGAEALLGVIGREQRIHPNYYLASNVKSGLEKSGVMQVVQH